MGISPLATITLRIGVLTTNYLIARNLFLVPFFEIYNLVTRGFRLFGNHFTFRRRLLPRLTRTRNVTRLTMESYTISGVEYGKGVTIVYPMTGSSVDELVIRIGDIRRMFFNFYNRQNEDVRFTILRGGHRPVRRHMAKDIRVRGNRAITFSFVPIDMTVIISTGTPLFNRIKILDTMGTSTVIVMKLTVTRL